MEWLNYHHLRYFWLVAKEGTLRRAAEKMSVSQPSVSSQIHLLEEALGAKLFRRSGRLLSLTDTGQIVYRYAENIFSTGQDLVDAVRDRPDYHPLRCQVGVTDSVPKIVASRLVAPAFHLSHPIHLLCREGSLERLLLELVAYRLDLVLADEPASRSLHVKTFSHPLGRCGSIFCAGPSMANRLRNRFPHSLHGAPALLPAETSPLRMSLETWFDAIGVRPRVVAEFEDSAFMMVLAGEGLGFVAAPSILAKDLLRRHGLRSFGASDECAHQDYFAITAERRLKHPAIIAITASPRSDLFP